MINFPFGTNGKSIIFGVPILKHITVFHGEMFSESECICSGQKC